MSERAIISLSAVVVAVTEDAPYVVVTRRRRQRACHSVNSIQPAIERLNSRFVAG
jgi:hypothetical protein